MNLAKYDKVEGHYIMVGIAKVSFEKIAMAVLPILIPLISALIFIAYVPQFTLWLPNLVMGPDYRWSAMCGAKGDRA